MDVGLTLKNCGRFDESEVGLQNPDGGHQESEGFDTRYVCNFTWLDVQTNSFLRETIALFLELLSPSA